MKKITAAVLSLVFITGFVAVANAETLVTMFFSGSKSIAEKAELLIEVEKVRVIKVVDSRGRNVCYVTLNSNLNSSSDISCVAL